MQATAYRIRFDVDSDFRMDIGFMSGFEVMAHLRIRGAGPAGAQKPPAPAVRSLARWRIDGRETRKGRP